MANFRPNLTTPIPNSSFSAPLNPYVVGPWWPEAVGSGLSVDLTTGVLNSTGGGGGGGIGTITSILPILTNTSGTNVTVSINYASLVSSGAVQLTSSLSSPSQSLALTAAAGKSLQDQLNALILGSSAGLTLIGTINGSTALIVTLVNSSNPSFVVGSPLPAAAPANKGTFLIVTTPGTMTPPNGVATATEEGDWWYSDGVNWTLIPIGNPPPAPATTYALGLVYGCTPDTGSGLFPVTALGRTGWNPYSQGNCVPLGGNTVIGRDSRIDYIGRNGLFGSVVVGNDTSTCDNAIAIGGCSRVNPGGGIVIGNCSELIESTGPSCCGGILIGNQLIGYSSSIALVTSPTSGTCLYKYCLGPKSIVIGSREKVTSSPGSDAEESIVIGYATQSGYTPNRAIAIGCNALTNTTRLGTPVTGGSYEPLAIGNGALSGLQISPVWGIGNTAVGHGSGQSTATGAYNVFFGALASRGDVSCSVVIGSYAAINGGSNDSVVIGAWAGVNGSGYGSIVIGSNAGCGSSSTRLGSYNVVIGTCAGRGLDSAVSESLIIGSGFCFNPPSTTNRCQLALGFNPTGAATSCYWLTGCSDKSIRPGAGILDCNNSAGTNGQVLASTGANAVVWSSGNTIPAGALMNFVQSTAPGGWLVANGDTVPNGTGTVQGVTTDFSALYAAVGSSFGGPGRLPDMRGMFTRGWDAAGGAARNCDPGRALGSQQGFALQSHCHEVNVVSGLAGRPEWQRPNSTCPTNASYPVSSGCSPINSGGYTSDTGIEETRPVNISVLPCIKY